jgi:hypothetical protein
MEQKINELKQLRSELAHWQEQKYYNDQARQEAMMDGRRHNEKVTDKIMTGLRNAEAELATFEMWNYEVVEALNEIEAAKAKAKTEAAIKSAWNN